MVNLNLDFIGLLDQTDLTAQPADWKVCGLQFVL